MNNPTYTPESAMGIVAHSDDIEDTPAGEIRAAAIAGRQPNLFVKLAAETARGKEMRYAEGFRVVTRVGDEAWEKHHGNVVF